MIIVAFFTLLLEYSLAGRLYSSRSELNETVHSKTRHAVSNFINTHQMNLLDHFIRKHKSLFVRSTYNGARNYFLLNEQKYDLTNDGIFSIPTGNHQSKNVTAFIKSRLEAVCSPRQSSSSKESNEAVSSVQACRPFADQAVAILKDLASFGPLSHTHKSLLEEFENYVYVRDKVLEYASEALNMTIYTSGNYDGATFYYFPPKPQLEMRVNGRGYVFGPHVDTHSLLSTYDRPIKYDTSVKIIQPYRKYTAVLFFTDTTPKTGGLFEWLDFPNNFNLPPKKGQSFAPIKELKYEVPVPRSYSPSFDDPDLSVVTIIPERAKLLLFHAEDDIHGSREYMGEVERWALVMQLTDKHGHLDEKRGVFPAYLKNKVGPTLRQKDVSKQ